MAVAAHARLWQVAFDLTEDRIRPEDLKQPCFGATAGACESDRDEGAGVQQRDVGAVCTWFTHRVVTTSSGGVSSLMSAASSVMAIRRRLALSAW